MRSGNGKEKIKGERVEKWGDQILIKDQYGHVLKSYKTDQVTQIKAVSDRQGSYALPGLGIGAAVGGACAPPNGWGGRWQIL